MSDKKTIYSILTNISKLTDVLVQAADIKDALSKSSYNLSGVLDNTRKVVNKLSEYADDIREKFHAAYPEEGEKPEVSDKITKPVLKLVDINKLVEPKTILKKDTPPKPRRSDRSVQFNTSIVVIDSSDEETNKTRTTRCEEIKFDEPPKKKAKPEKPLLEEEIELSSDESKSSSSDEEEVSPRITRRRPTTRRSSINKNVPELSRDDVKLNSKCFVKVYKVPSEKMKKFYAEKLELRSIKNLSKINNIKRKRIRRSSSSSSSGTDCNVEEKQTKNIGKKTKLSLRKRAISESSSSSSSSSDEEPAKEETKTSSDVRSEEISTTKNDSDSDREAELALDQIEANSNSRKSSTDDNDSEDEIEGSKKKGNEKNKSRTGEKAKKKKRPVDKLLAANIDNDSDTDKETRNEPSLLNNTLKLPVPLDSEEEENATENTKNQQIEKDIDLNANIDKNGINKQSVDENAKNGAKDSISEAESHNGEISDPDEKTEKSDSEKCKKRSKKDASSGSDNSENENKTKKAKKDSAESDSKKNDNTKKSADNKEESDSEEKRYEKSKKSKESDSEERNKDESKNSDVEENENKSKKRAGSGDDSDPERNQEKKKPKKDVTSSDDSDLENKKRSKENPTDSDDSDSAKKKKKKSSKYEISGSDSESEKKKKKNKKDALSSDDSDLENGKKKSKNDSTDSDDSDTAKNKKKKKKSSKYDISESDAESKKKKKKPNSEEELEDSDCDFERKKKKKRKAKKKIVILDSDSDNQKSSSSEESEESSSSESDKEKKVTKKPKLKRVKRINDSSSEDEDQKDTRKHIKKILARDSLAKATVEAEDEEKQRKARIAEKQKKYNQIFEVNTENSKVDKVVLDFDENTKEELLAVDEKIVEKLKPHQASGIQFMWDACYESLERTETTKGSGCILAHCMGLGKTLQVIALTHTLIINSEKTKVNTVMVVCPLNTVLNWVQEYRMWMPDEDDFEVYELVSCKNHHERSYKIADWSRHGGVLIIGYNMFRILSNPNGRLPRKIKKPIYEGLVDPGPDLVICDEGHLLKNEKTHLSIAMNRLKTLRRIVLTGTPLQNNLKEYFCMVQFVKPNLLGTYKEYLNRFVNPITNGQYTDSTLLDIQVMRKRSHVLHKMLDGVVQRRDYAVLQPYLPPKYEYVLFLNLTEVQIKLYRHYMQNFAQKRSSKRTSFLFVDFQALQRICTHPRVLLDKSIEEKNAREMREYEDEDESEGSLKDFIDDESDDDKSDTPSKSDGNSNESGDEGAKAAPKRKTRAAAALQREAGEESDVELTVEFEKSEWWQQYCDGKELDQICHSNKIFLLFEILKECEQIGDKVLVFSQSLYSLNVIEYFLHLVDTATQDNKTEKYGGFSGSWSHGLDYYRLDGSTSSDRRNVWCKNFNDPRNPRARLFLISTKAGGLGINLVAANRVIIFDVSWNPSHDIQSIYRVYRFGQTKPCYIYRFVTNGTMEMKIYERQVIKQSISKRVIDEQQIDRHYNQTDLQELYSFEPYPRERPTPLVPKDVLLGELLQKYEERIYKYHEHQSLLENKEEEGLNEEERKLAWEEFENEKKARVNVQSAMSGVLTPQMMQLGLASMLRREYPGLTDSQINAFIPSYSIELQKQMELGDYTLLRRLQQEVKILQAVQAQKYSQQMYQQQALKWLQQAQMQQTLNFPNAMNAMNGGPNNQPGPSTSTEPEIIDLND